MRPATVCKLLFVTGLAALAPPAIARAMAQFPIVGGISGSETSVSDDARKAAEQGVALLSSNSNGLLTSTLPNAVPPLTLKAVNQVRTQVPADAVKFVGTACALVG
jgi:hypothetical protein